MAASLPNASDADPTLNNGDSSAPSYEATAIVSTHEIAQYYRQHMCPSLTSFVRFFDCAEGVYSTSSASPSWEVAPTTSLSEVDGATRVLKDCIADRPGYASLAKGTDVQFPSRLATEQVISVAPSMLKQQIDSNGRVNR